MSSSGGEFAKVIQAIQMDQQSDWRKKYFTDEQLETMDELIRTSCSDEARTALSAEQRPFQVPLSQAEAAFLEQARAIYRASRLSRTE